MEALHRSGCVVPAAKFIPPRRRLRASVETVETPMTEIPRQYEPAQAQARWFPYWEEHGCFDASAGSTRPPHTIMIPLPNVTGALHMGHALNGTLQDLITRLKRMQGCEALWMPGTDHAGIATQAVVERRMLEEEGLTRHDIGREALVNRIWRWKDAYEERIVQQLKQLGASCDWRRMRFTLDDVCSRAVRPETLDPALLRPGRFDRHVLVDRPDVKGREAILKVHAARIRLDSDVDLGHLARLTPGFVGADLANLVNEAALLAARNNKPRVTMHEFEEGVERVVAGLEKHTRIIHQDEKLRVAYHECGHALVACSLPGTDPVHKISIIPRGLGALGYTLQRPEDDRQLHTQTDLENRICVLLGGILTEELIFDEISTGAQNDLQRATDIARRMVTEFGMSVRLGRVHYSETQRSPFLQNSQVSTEYTHSEQTIREIDLEVRRLIDEASASVRDILVNRREALEQMSRELMEVEVMDAAHLKRILDDHRTSPQISPGTRSRASDGSTTAAPPSTEAQAENTTRDETSPEEPPAAGTGNGA